MWPEAIWQLLIAWAATAAVMALLWWRQTKTLNANAVDVAWTFGIGLVAIGFLVTGEGDVGRRLFGGALAAAWSLRLGLYLFLTRVLHEAEEDGRYQMLRQRWSQRGFFLFYQAQAVFVILFSLPFLVIAHDPTSLPTVADWAGGALWVVGLVGVVIADQQLAAFRADASTKGQVCTRGLWRYSRHPNYFFEWLLWVALAVVATGGPSGYLAWVTPAALLYLFFFVTGIPYTERRALASRGDAYRRYQQATSVFVPWFPKRSST